MSKENHTESTKIKTVTNNREQNNETMENILKYKKRMLEWPNPVEYVNNMYGCHPWDKNTEYFQVIFGKKNEVENG